MTLNNTIANVYKVFTIHGDTRTIVQYANISRKYMWNRFWRLCLVTSLVWNDALQVKGFSYAFYRTHKYFTHAHCQNPIQCIVCSYVFSECAHLKLCSCRLLKFFLCRMLNGENTAFTLNAFTSTLLLQTFYRFFSLSRHAERIICCAYRISSNLSTSSIHANGSAMDVLLMQLK